MTADQALAGAAARHSLSQPGSSIIEIATGVVGLHNTSPVSPYLSIRARLPGFSRTALDMEMWDAWSIARFRGMRLTMFILPHDLLEIVAAATRHISEKQAARWLEESGLSRLDFNRFEDDVIAALADGPLTVRGLRQTLDIPQSIDLPGIVGRMCDVGKLVGGRPPRNWRSGVRRYHRWEHVLPNVDLHRWDEAAAIRELIYRYVRNYGPVTINDISWWTGFTKRRCRAGLAALNLVEVEVEGWPGPLYTATDMTPTVELDSRVHALPMLDPYVQGYRERTRFLLPGRHTFVYDGGGNATATLMQRGRIVGVWQAADEPVQSIRYHLFAGVPASVRRSAESELAAVGALLFDRRVDVEEVPTMKPLDADGGRSANHPLDSRIHRASRRRRT